jgi:hypothetical protein
MPLSGLLARSLLKAMRDEVTRKFLRPCGFLGFLLAVSLHAPSALCQLSTEDHLAEPGFWPTQDSPSRDNTGDACARCHQGRLPRRKPLARAAMSLPFPTFCITSSDDPLAQTEYKYQIEGGEPGRYSVRESELTVAALWGVWTGRVAVTCSRKQGRFFPGQRSLLRDPRNNRFHAIASVAVSVGIERRCRPFPRRKYGVSVYTQLYWRTFDDPFVPELLDLSRTGHPCQSVTAGPCFTGGRSQPSSTPHLSAPDAVDFYRACHGT